MKENKLTITINKPITDVFEFTINPDKTPEWINSIVSEQTNEWPPRVGTIYKNKGPSGPWATYVVTKYEDSKEFELNKQDGSTYHVNYKYTQCPEGGTELIYHEWVTEGQLEDPLTQDTLANLKNALEKHELSYLALK